MDSIVIAGLIFLAGFVGTLFGVGGGVFLVPALFLWVDIPLIEAMKISLLASLITGLVGVWRLPNWTGELAYEHSLRLEPMALAGAAVGAWCSHFLSSDVLIGILAFFLAFIGFLVVWRNNQHENIAANISYHQRLRRGQIGATVAGLCGGLLGIGGGVILVPMLGILARIRVKEAITISLFILISTSAVALCARTAATGSFWSIEDISVILILPAGLLGSHVRHLIRENTISILFTFYCFLMSFIVFMRIIVKA